jgi:hypothetical protein
MAGSIAISSAPPAAQPHDDSVLRISRAVEFENLREAFDYPLQPPPPARTIGAIETPQIRRRPDLRSRCRDAIIRNPRLDQGVKTADQGGNDV